jgi:hypothetical protein
MTMLLPLPALFRGVAHPCLDQFYSGRVSGSMPT